MPEPIRVFEQTMVMAVGIVVISSFLGIFSEGSTSHFFLSLAFAVVVLTPVFLISRMASKMAKYIYLAIISIIFLFFFVVLMGFLTSGLFVSIEFTEWMFLGCTVGAAQWLFCEKSERWFNTKG